MGYFGPHGHRDHHRGGCHHGGGFYHGGLLGHSYHPPHMRGYFGGSLFLPPYAPYASPFLGSVYGPPAVLGWRAVGALALLDGVSGMLSRMFR